MNASTPTGVRRIVGAAVITATMAAGLAGCMRPSPPSTVFSAQADEMQRSTPDQRPWFCNGVGNGTPLSGHGNGHVVNPVYAGKTKGPLDWTNCIALSRQLDQTHGAVKPWDTKGKAEAAGWYAAAPFQKGVGTHHVRLTGGYSAGFDPTKPQFLIFGGNEPDAPLIGVAFTVPGNLAAPPPAYAGENDWWHKHTVVCFEANPTRFPPIDLANAEEVSDEECAALGGRNTSLGAGIWFLHLWISPPYEYRLDVFASGHNCLGTERIAPLTDPCWEIAKRDPALGMPAGGEHGH
jgi:hypothetical protein